MASSSSAAAPPQQLFWPPPAAFTSNAAPPQFWPPPQLNGTAADRYFSAQKEQNAPYTRRRAALVSRAVQAMGTRWWPYQLKEAGAHTLLHGAGEYIAYDTFVEAADQAFDLGHPLVPTHAWAAPLRAMWAGAFSLRVFGRPAQLFTFRLRAAYALMRTEGEANEPWRMQCVSQINTVVTYAAPGENADGNAMSLSVGCGGSAVCQRCLQLYHLAGFGASTGNAVWGSYSNCMPGRVALAEVVLRAWLCEDQRKREMGIGPYWMQRRAALAADQTNSINRLHLSDVASVGVAGPLGTCSDLGQEAALGNIFEDDFHLDTASAATGALGAHCTLVHDMLWPHKPRLIQLAWRQIAELGLAGGAAGRCAIQSVPTHALRASVMELAYELLEAGVPLEGFLCNAQRVEDNSARFSFVNRFPAPDGGCGRAFAATGSGARERAANLRGRAADPLANAKSSKNDLLLWLRWALSLLRAAPAVAASGMLDQVDAQLRLLAVEAHSGLDRGGAAWPDSYSPGRSPLLALYWLLWEAGGRPEAEATQVWSPCDSANNAACGWLHGRHATAAELLRDALCPVVVVFLARLKFLPVIEDALAELSGSYRQWIESYGLRDMPVAANVPKGGGGTLGEWVVALTNGLNELRWAVTEVGHNGAIDLDELEALLRDWSCVTMCIFSKATGGQGKPYGPHAILPTLLHLYKKLRPVFAHHHGRLAASPLFGATMFNQQAALFDLVPRDRLMFTEEKVDLFLRMRTAGLPYTLSERASEERYVTHQMSRERRAENYAQRSGYWAGLLFSSRAEGCICCSSDAAVAAGVAFRAQRDATAPAATADGAAAAAEAGQYSFLSKRDPTTKLPQQDYYDMERGAAEGGAEGGAAADADADADADAGDADAEGGAASRQSLERMDVVTGLLAALDSGIGAAVAGAHKAAIAAEARKKEPPKPLTPREFYALADQMDGAQREASGRLSHPSVLKPAALGGYRPQCPPERPNCVAVGALARVARMLGPDNNFRMLDDELGALEAEAAKRLMRDRGAGDVLLG